MNEKERDKNRIHRIVHLLQAIWETNPDMRFFQLIDALKHEYSNDNNKFGLRKANEKNSKGLEIPISFIDLFYLEDDIFEEFLLDYVNSNRQRQKNSDMAFMSILDSNNISELIKYVKFHGVNQEINGASLLYWAVFVDQEQIVNKLLALGAEPNQKSSNGTRPLEVGAYFGFYECCKLLLVNGAEVDESVLQRAKEGWAGNQQDEIAKLLYEWQHR